MSGVLSDQEKEKIRRDQMRRIAEVQKQRELGKKLPGVEEATRRMLKKESEDRERDKAREDYEQKIFEEEMKKRGFVQYQGEWVSKEEYLRLREAEDAEKQRMEDKVEKAKERKIDRAEETYLGLRDRHDNQITQLTRLIWLAVLAMVAGSILPAFFAVTKIFTVTMLLILGGLLIAVPCGIYLFEMERMLMKAQRCIYEDELHDFEYRDIKSPVRRLLRWLVTRYDHEIRELF